MPSLEKDFNQIINLIQSSNKILITSHVSPDGDSIGSSLALWNFLKEQGKKPKVVMNDSIPSNLRFLKGADKIAKYDPNENYKGFDLVVILDLNQHNRIGNLWYDLENIDCTKIVIDHHQEPKEFANFYYIDTQSSSTSEILYEMMNEWNNKYINQATAEALYVGIMTDTGSFHFDRTDARLFEIASDLVNKGANPTNLYESVLSVNSFNSLQLMGKALTNMELYFDGKFCLMPITQSDFEKSNTHPGDTEGFVSFTLSIQGTKIGALLTQVPEEKIVKLSLRSKKGISIREIAVKFGGGGHNQASGANIKDTTLEIVKEQLIEYIGELFKKNPNL